MHDTTPINDDLRKWIISQAQTGCTPDTLIQAMLSVGWNEAVAIKAIDSTLRDHLTTQEAIAMPNPNLEGSPLYLDVGDKVVTVLASMQNPRIVVLDGFLSDAQNEKVQDRRQRNGWRTGSRGTNKRRYVFPPGRKRIG